MSDQTVTKQGPTKTTNHQVSAATIPAKFLESAQKYPDKAALLYKKDHTFGYIQYKRLQNLVENFTISLEKLGVKKGDRVVLISENRPEWVVSDLSVKSLGAILVPLHKTFSAEQIRTFIYEVEPSLIIVSDKSTFNKVHGIKRDLKKNIRVVFLEIKGPEEQIITDGNCDFISALQLVKHDDDYKSNYQKRLAEVSPNEVAAIIYTPSDNGRYKGVQLTHLNFVADVEGCKEAVKFYENDRFLSVLPLSHAFEKTTGYYIPLFTGATVHYMADLSEFTKTTKRYKPTVIMGVPRVFEKTYQKSVNKVNKNRLARTLFNKAMANGTSGHRSNLSKYLSERLIFSKVRAQLGGQIRLMISGGAALKSEVGKFFDKVGIPLLEGYGLTEAGPVVSVNRLSNYRFGTVGPPLPNVKVKIADDDEILLKGSTLTPGYFKNDKEDRRHFDNGWFRTGDYGEIDRDGFIKIIGKKKEIIVLSTGKNVSPNAIETQLVKSKYIDQVLVVGDGQKHIAALIAPNASVIPSSRPVVLSSSPVILSEAKNLNKKEVKDFIQQEIDRLLLNFAPHEQIRKFLLIDPVDLKTETLTHPKWTRRILISKYSREIADLYEEENQLSNSSLFN